MGEISAAESLARGELQLSRRTGFKPAEAFSWFLLGYSAYYGGKLERAERCFTLSVAHEGTRANFAPVLALLRCSRGRIAEAESLLVEALSPSNPATPRSIALAVLALIQARKGDANAAFATAENAVELAAATTTFGYAGAPFFSCLFEVYLAEAARGGPSAVAASRSLRRLRRHCRAWARAFRVGQPLFLLYSGRLAQLRGARARAIRFWRRSRDFAVRLDSKLYVVLAEGALSSTPGDPLPVRRARARSAT
jgi:tetratricopeptide (TPR) repeat protein